MSDPVAGPTTPSLPRTAAAFCRPHLAPLAAMAVATGAFVWPLVLRITTHVPGNERSEVWGHIWAHWVPGHNLFALGSSPFRAPLVHCPDGVGFYTNDPIHAGLVTVLRPLFGLVTAFDTMMILAVLATMLATYVLALELSGSRAAATGAGIAAGLGPYVRSAFIDGYSEALGLFWAALVLALLLRLLRRPSWWAAALCGVCFAAVYYSDLYTTLGLAAAYCLAAGAALALSPRKALARLPLLAAGPLLGVLLAIPGVLALRSAAPPLEAEGAETPEVTGALHHLPPADQCWQRAGRRAAVDLAALLPVADLDPSCNVPLTKAVYPGLIAQLCLLGLALARPRERIGLLLGAGACLALSFGIYVTVHGEVLTLGDRPLLGPTGLVARALPTVWGMNSIYRFVSVYCLVAAASLALPAAWLLRRGRWGRAGAAALMVAALVDLMAFGHIPFPTPVTGASPSQAFTWLAEADGDGAVLEWPVPAAWDHWAPASGETLPDQKVLFHQTVHQRCYGGPGPSAWLYFTAHPEADVPVEQRPPGLGRWGRGPAAELMTGLTTLATGGLVEADGDLAASLAAADVDYVVVHTMQLGNANATAARGYLTELLGPPQIFDGGVEVYRVAPAVKD